MKKKLFENWDFMRILRLVVGLWLGYSAFADKQLIIGMMAGIFLIQAILNMGCGSNGCSIPNGRKIVNSKPEDVSFEEIK